MQEVEMYTRDIDVNIEEGTGVEILYSEEGVVQVQVKAPKLIKFKGKDSYTEMPESLELIFFNNNGGIGSKLTADYGITFDKRKTMKAIGNVKLINRKGEQIHADEMIWDQQNKKIYSDKPVKVTTKDEVIFGEGFESNEDFSEYSINHMTGKIKLDKIYED